MTEQTLEGTWEEIVARAPELRGRRITVAIPNASETEAEEAMRQAEMRLAWENWKQTPIPEEELRSLDQFGEFRKEHPVQFRRLDFDE